MEKNPKVRIIPAKEKNIRIERVGIYARVSTAGRAQLRSLAAQISGLTRYVAKQEGWLLTDIYMDVDSAKTGSDRREFARLLTDCKNHELDYVITKSVSRFGRDNVEVIGAVRLLQESGVKIYFMEDELDVDKNYDESELTIRAAINQSENEHRSENIRMGMKFRAEHGSSGLYKKPCYGYKKNAEGNLVPDEKQAAIVRMIYELYLSGVSIIGIINALAEDKIPSPKGSGTWSKKTISTILTNAKYTGNVQILKSDPGRNSYCMWDAHEAIVSMEDFEQVQKEIERRTKKKRKYESAASSLVKEINWKEPINSTGPAESRQEDHEINWPEPEGR
jgi:site-specific DNA recombinase